MNRNLNEMFSMVYGDCEIKYNEKKYDDLFGLVESAPSYNYDKTDIIIISDFYSGNLDVSLLNKSARNFLDISINAFDIFLHAWMSEFPIERELITFGRKILSVTQTQTAEKKFKNEAAERILTDRTDLNTISILNAAHKTQREFHRMQGLLRFSPDENGVYIAKCAPDHLILPVFGWYLSARFGGTGWSVIDEKRSLCISRNPPNPYKITQLKNKNYQNSAYDQWEGLWKHYHKTINNESRNNANLQRQLMPKRYWKYLPEVQ